VPFLAPSLCKSDLECPVIHSYGRLSCLYVTFQVSHMATQKIAEQIQLDEDVISLLDAMEQALHLAPETELLDVARLRSSCERSANRRKTVMHMMAQISECGHFIQSYVKDVNFCVHIFSFILYGCANS